ncbi:MAG: hypothetical protein B7Y05_20350 [Polynucleobacter sp. 24-46-87]|nr:MAG: hypothetical protein B7Y05_20350 [Polynucleobacter sp. 24-46-87]
MDTLFFIISKIVQFCIEPLNWVIVFVALSLLFLSLRKPHLSKRFLVLALADLLLVGWLPSSEVFLRALEEAVPKINVAQISQNDLGGIIILGGAIEGGEIAVDRGEVSIYSSAERVTKAFELIRRYDQNAHYEKQSRNTYENVLYMKPMILGLEAKGINGEVLTPKPWLLITSASHMYRSLQIFQKQGIEVIPVPVDYQTAHKLRWTTFDLEDGAQNWNKLVHEVIGLLAYWMTGKI